MERSLEQLYAIKFCVRLGKNATETFQMLQKAFKDDCISRSQSGKWHKAFKEGREEIADEPRSGRPTTARTDEIVDRVLEVLRTDRRLSIQQIADTLHMSTFVVNRIVTEDLQMRKVFVKGSKTEQHLKKAIDLKQKLQNSLDKFSEIKIDDRKVFDPSGFSGSEESDEEELVEVPKKEGFEPVIPPHKRKDYGRSWEAEPSTSSKMADKKAEMLARAPRLPFDLDLYHWEEKEIIPPTIVKFDCSHKFWKPISNDTTDFVDKKKPWTKPTLSVPTFFDAALEYTKVAIIGSRVNAHSLDRILLPRGFCNRITPYQTINYAYSCHYDPSGRPRSYKTSLHRQTYSLIEWKHSSMKYQKDPTLLAELKAATGVDLTVPKKGQRKSKKKFPELTNLKTLNNTTRNRLEKKIFNKAPTCVMSRSTAERVASTLDKIDERKFDDKTSDTGGGGRDVLVVGGNFLRPTEGGFFLWKSGVFATFGVGIGLHWFLWILLSSLFHLSVQTVVYLLTCTLASTILSTLRTGESVISWDLWDQCYLMLDEPRCQLYPAVVVEGDTAGPKGWPLLDESKEELKEIIEKVKKKVKKSSWPSQNGPVIQGQSGIIENASWAFVIDHHCVSTMSQSIGLSEPYGLIDTKNGTCRKRALRPMHLAALASLMCAVSTGMTIGYSASTEPALHCGNTKPTELCLNADQMKWFLSIISIGGLVGCLLAGKCASSVYFIIRDFLPRRET
ncbi:hypothetical protein LAZ67_5004372 [Cordylochernes scorpioides]|uniref:Mos1 transposase HTH domain-containing protein n=1 Tax=Cordylochernes scorpioides TaxID=51811 RepID=A0ABY6KIL7_9ARAC|nr:hypothetical protein LAZ67_5004372 [Cordylochernes scorpioides]